MEQVGRYACSYNGAVRSDLLVFGNRIRVECYFMDLDVVERSVTAVHWLSLHKVKRLKPVDNLA
jgi:hypothetical protein